MILADKLYGLVLSGGKSTRMGKDKGLLDYHGTPQRGYTYNLLSQVCDETFLSIRKNQADEIPNDFKTILDEDEFKGPFNGILSAHKKHPKVAWLVLACDMPLMSVEALQELIAARNPNKLATAFALKENPLPEPLAAIWEANSLSLAIDFMQSQLGTCPRKFLIHNDAQLVFPTNENVVLNANSEADYLEALKIVAANER
jgi:molybdopterin-guanine dinucleotide biosynthesis protein A